MRIDGELVVGPGPDQGMVFQGYSLFPWKSVTQNIAFGLRAPAGRRLTAQAGWTSCSASWAHRVRGVSARAALRRHATSGPPSPRRSPRSGRCCSTSRHRSTPRPGWPCRTSCYQVRTRCHDPPGHPRRERGGLPLTLGLRTDTAARPGLRGDRRAVRERPWSVSNAPRFLDPPRGDRGDPACALLWPDGASPVAGPIDQVEALTATVAVSLGRSRSGLTAAQPLGVRELRHGHCLLSHQSSLPSRRRSAAPG